MSSAICVADASGAWSRTCRSSGFVYRLFGLDGAVPHTCLLQNGAIRLSIAGYHENRLDELKQHVGANLKQSAIR